MTRSILLIASSALFVAPALAAGATIADSTFQDANWSLTSFAYGPNGGSGVATQATLGVTNAVRQVTNTCGANFSGAVNFSIFEQQGYDPSVSGAVTSLAFAMDARYVDGLSSFGFAVEQDGQFWMIGYFLNTSAWRTYSLVPALVDYTPVGDANPLGPNFSTSGSMLHFGFWTSNSSAGGSGYSHTGQYDNFAVVVPGPGALAVLGAAAVSWGGGRRRRDARAGSPSAGIRQPSGRC